MEITASRRRVSGIELPAQQLEIKVKSRRTGIFSAKSSRDLAKTVINDSVEGGDGRFVMVYITPESFVNGAFPPGDPNRGF